MEKLHHLKMDVLNIYVFGLLLLVISAGGYRPPQKLRCKYTHKFRKYTADCVGLNLVEVPRDLNEDIEILVANDNRIRELTNDSLTPYGVLQYLYLSNNFINYIEPGAFNSVPKLEVLDLSVNGLRIMPGEVPLPLRKLYLSENRDIVIMPLTKAYNLQYLTLAECHLSALPAIGQLPYLTELNLTGNPISTILAEQLAPLCRLELLHVPDYLFHNKKENICRCHEFVHWTSKYGIQSSILFNCTELSEVEHELCLSNRSAWFEARQECLARKPPFTLNSVSVVTGVGIGLVLMVSLVVCCLWRRSRRKRNSVKHHNHNQQSKNHRLSSPDIDSITNNHRFTPPDIDSITKKSTDV